jgi:hypothetical protein
MIGWKSLISLHKAIQCFGLWIPVLPPNAFAFGLDRNDKRGQERLSFRPRSNPLLLCGAAQPNPAHKGFDRRAGIQSHKLGVPLDRDHIRLRQL